MLICCDSENEMMFCRSFPRQAIKSTSLLSRTSGINKLMDNGMIRAMRLECAFRMCLELCGLEGKQHFIISPVCFLARVCSRQRTSEARVGIDLKC